MNDTPNLALPYILAAQAQKHVTHNEAIRALDCLVQLAVESRALTAPPSSPGDGSRFVVAAAATGDWAGQSGKIAAFQDGVWAFYDPKEGWTAWVADEHALVIYAAGEWAPYAGTGGGGGSGDGGGGLTSPVANSDLANVSSGTIKGRASAGSGHPEDLTGTQATALLDAFIGSGASHKKGLVPDPGSSAGTAKFLREDGTWAEPPSGGGDDASGITELDDLTHIGINATGDTTNRLSLKSPASLFDHVGNGHQQKINKHAAGDTASVLYQTNYSGRAEMGLTGDDDFHFKVSPDGTTWHDAIIIDKVTGEVSFPSNPAVGGGDTDVSELALSMTLLALQVADNTNVALFLGDKKNRVFDSFDALTYVNTGGATNLDTSAPGILAPARDGVDGSVTSLMHFDGSDGATTSADSAPVSPGYWTFSNGAQLDNAQSKFGGTSCLFDGVDDVVTGPGGAPFGFGTGDFCVEFWVRFNNLTGLQVLYDGRQGANGNYVFIDKVATTNVLTVVVNSVTVITGTTAMTTGGWHHIALARSGTATKLFLDGTQEGSTFTDTTNYATPVGGYPFLGRSTTAATNFLSGWIDELRVSKGAARYTGTFSPPTYAFGSTTNNLTVTSTAFTAASAPTTMKGVIRIKEIDAATAGTDYTLEFSRDSGATWALATLTKLFTSPSPDSSIAVLQTNDVGVSSQPTGTGPMWRFKTLNSKNVQLYDAAIYWS